jgi:hypothetical protein
MSGEMVRRLPFEYHAICDLADRRAELDEGSCHRVADEATPFLAEEPDIRPA